MGNGKRKRWLALWLVGVLCIGLFSGRQVSEGQAAETAQSEKTDSGDYGLENPRMNNGITTWDCIYFGRYQQSEYTPKQAPEQPVSGETYVDTDGTKMVYSEWKKADAVDGQTVIIDCPPGYYKIEPIKWRVLSIEGDEAFLMADQNLDCREYNSKLMGTSWETCTLRSWLNGYGADKNSLGEDHSGAGFLNYAFTEDERKAIQTVTVENSKNPVYNTAAGNNTSDQIYLLSYDELYDTAYGFENVEYTFTRYAEATDYAEKGGGIQSTNVASPPVYWTRSPGTYTSKACAVMSDVLVHPYNVNYTQMLIRPVLHLNLSEAQGLWSKAASATAGLPSATPTPSSAATTEPAVTPEITAEATATPSLQPVITPTATPEVTAAPSLEPGIGSTDTPTPPVASPTAIPAWLVPEVVYDAADLDTFAGRTKDEAERKYSQVKHAAPGYVETDTSSFYEIQPSFTAPYYPGTLSEDTLKAMLSLCNYYRWLVGSEEVQGYTSQTIYIDSEWNEFQQQAFMWNFSAKPDDFPNEKWVKRDTSYYEFAQGNSPLEAIRNAVNMKCTSWDQDGYFTYSLRKDILSPGNGDVWLRMGFNGNWLAAQRAEQPVHGGSDNKPVFYSYPSEGYMPNDLITVKDTAWSVRINRNYLTIPSGKDVSITVRHQESGEIFKRSVETENAYADYDTILFEEPAAEELSVYTGTYDVEIEGLLDVATQKGAKLCYTVTFFEAKDVPYETEEPKSDSDNGSETGNTGGGNSDTDGTGKNNGSNAGGNGSAAGSNVQNMPGGNTGTGQSADDSYMSDGEDDDDRNTDDDRKTVTIPKVGKVKKVTLKKKKNDAVLKWKKNLQVAGYEIQISTKKNFKGAKKVILKKKAAKYTISGLKAKKTYYVRIRAYCAYQTQQGKTKKAYGKFSAKKKVKL